MTQERAGTPPRSPRYIYFTADFAGSGALLRSLVTITGTAPVAVVLSRRARGRAFVKAIWRRSGLRYLVYLAMVGIAHRSVQAILRRLSVSKIGLWNALNIRDVADRLCVPILSVAKVDASDDVLSDIAAMSPDVMCSVFFDQRLPESWLALTPRGAVNVHNSLLPAYAGCAPTIASLAQGRAEVGVTVHVMNSDFDAGRILGQEKLEVEPGATVLGIDRRLMKTGIEILADILMQQDDLARLGIEQDTDHRSYVTHPTKGTVHALYGNGYRLWNVKDYLRCCIE